MTREEQRCVRELSKSMEKASRPNSKKYGYKSISGFLYKVVNEYLYELIISVPPVGCGKSIDVQLWCKPLAIDDMFWEVFEMLDEAKKQPFSFHVTGAFTPYCHTLEKWSVNVSADYNVDEIYKEIIERANEFISNYAEKLVTVNDFKQELLDKKSVFTLNVLLCELCEGNYRKVLSCLDDEKMNRKSVGFSSVDGGDIYDYMRRYCEKRV